MNPLDQLADINLPTEVAIWPLAWGYWLVAVVTLLAIIWAIYAAMAYRTFRRQKKYALLGVRALDPASKEFALQLQAIIKALCAHYAPALNTQRLHGQAWQNVVQTLYQGSQVMALKQALVLMQARLYAASSSNDANAIISENEQLALVFGDFIAASFPCKPATIGALTSPIPAQDTNEVKHV